jgi:hypothetical protein
MFLYSGDISLQSLIQKILLCSLNAREKRHCQLVYGKCLLRRGDVRLISKPEPRQLVELNLFLAAEVTLATVKWRPCTQPPTTVHCPLIPCLLAVAVPQASGPQPSQSCCSPCNAETGFTDARLTNEEFALLCHGPVIVLTTKGTHCQPQYCPVCSSLSYSSQTHSGSSADPSSSSPVL